MRAGKVARGGIRWSDRKEDFRTEILGLMKAQTVKNAVIVPVGSKGGFVVKQPPASAERLAAEAVECYRTLIRGLLDLTDNIVADNSGRGTGSCRRRRSSGMTATTPISSSPPTKAPRRSPISPTRSRRSTGSGSATRSPRAARRATTTRRWAITSRGAWELVKRHFRELGRDIENERAQRGRGRRHVGRRVRQRHADVAPHATARRVQPPAHLYRSRARSRKELCRAAASIPPAALELGGLRPRADLGRRRRVRTRRQIDPDQPRDEARLRHRGRPSDPGRVDPPAVGRTGRSSVLRRHRHLTSRLPTRATSKSATAPTTRCASMATRFEQKWSARAPISPSPSAGASPMR